MLRDRAGLHVRAGTQLERNALVPQQRRESAQPHRAVLSHVDVVDDADTVTEPVGAAECDGLVDGRQPERLAGVNREAGVVVSHVLESIQVPGRRVAGLRAGDVEAHHTPVPEPDRQLGDLERPRGVPHCGDQAAHRDGAALAAGGLLAVGEPGQHRVDHRIEREPAVDVQFGGETDLGVDDVVIGQVLDALVGHPVQRLRCLHHPDRVGEGFQVTLERSAVRRRAEQGRQLIDTSGGQLDVTVLFGQFHHRGRAQPTVEMVVQQRLRRVPDRVQGQRCRHGVIRSMISGRSRRVGAPPACGECRRRSSHRRARPRPRRTVPGCRCRG